MNRRLTCRDIDSLLDLDGIEARPDRARVSEHLNTCAACREKAPELAWLYGHLEVSTARVRAARRRRAVQAGSWAAAVLVALTVLTLVPNRPEPVERSTNPAVVLPDFVPTRTLPDHFSTVEMSTTNILPEQSVSSTTAGSISSSGLPTGRRSGDMEWIR